MDCSMEVFEVYLGPNVIGIAQEFEMEQAQSPLPIYQVGQAQPVGHVQKGPINTQIRVRMLMTRDQKYMFAVTQRLLGRIELSIDMHENGKYLLHGKPEIDSETLSLLAQKKHSDDEFEFILNDASMEKIEEKKHGKSKTRIY